MASPREEIRKAMGVQWMELCLRLKEDEEGRCVMITD
jgi:hypothetical protein